MTQSAHLDAHQAYRDQGIHTGPIFFASFMTLIAAGIGFAIRGGILSDWGAQFGFTKSELGVISGMGLAGFGFTIIFFSFFADIVGYRALLIGGFVLHTLSAVITVAAIPIYQSSAGKDGAYWCLYIGSFVFSLANGLCEAAINPLTATLYPQNKTHYLNILHAGWPGGLMLGALIVYMFHGNGAAVTKLPWQVLLGLYVLPALYYGMVSITNKFPISEAKAAGVNIGHMIGYVFAPMLLFLFLIHAMVGYVELGTDNWIQNIMGNTIANKASLLLVYTSLLMFVLRFFAGPIVHKINPLGLLFVSACCGAIGLFLLGNIGVGAVSMAFVAGTIFALGKTFYWPTMLGVIGERFPKAGALAMGLSGGIGMLSAGFLGGPGIGYTQDVNAKEKLVAVAPQTYERIKAENENHFLFLKPIQGLDGQKVDAIGDKGKQLAEDLAKKPDEPNLKKLSTWYSKVEAPNVDKDQPIVSDAVVHGGKQALKITAAVPATMAACYLLLVFYFASKGGYKQVHIGDGH